MALRVFTARLSSNGPYCIRLILNTRGCCFSTHTFTQNLHTTMAEAARVALRGLAASANALNQKQAMHTPLVLGGLGACCVLSWVYGASFYVDSK